MNLHDDYRMFACSPDSQYASSTVTIPEPFYFTTEMRIPSSGGIEPPKEWGCKWCGQTNMILELCCQYCGGPRKPLR